MAKFFRLFKSKKKPKAQEPQVKKNIGLLPVIIVVDASESMTEEKLLHVNNALRKTIGNYADYNKDDSHKGKIKIAVMQFSDKAEWLTEGLVDPTGLQLEITADKNTADYVRALLELEGRLSAADFIAQPELWDAPYIFFISAGGSSSDCSEVLNKLHANGLYSSAKRRAIALGSEADCDFLRKIAGDTGKVTIASTDKFISSVLYYIERLVEAEYLKLLCDPFGAEIGHDFVFDFGSSCYDYGSSGSFGEDVSCFGGFPSYSFDWDSDPFEDAPVSVNKTKSSDSEESSFSGIDVPDGKLAAGGHYCGTCGASVGDGARFCQRCGSVVDRGAPSAAFNEPVKSSPPPPVMSNMSQPQACYSCKEDDKVEKSKASAEARLSQVQFSAVVPKRIIKGEYAMIDITVYEDEYRNVVERIISNAVNEVREVVASSAEVAKNTSVRIVLSSPDIELTDCDESQIWKGRYLEFSFPVEIPVNYAKKQILFIATVYFNDFIATKLKFVVNCTSEREQKIELTREDVLTAFISYASQDRSRVASIIQGMQKARPDMDIFFDIESLRSGEDWEKVLRREIERRDVLFLCWSNFAKNSEWVEKEWRYALINKGLDSIEPIPLVSPVECPPPEELKSKHFNDRALLYKDL